MNNPHDLDDESIKEISIEQSQKDQWWVIVNPEISTLVRSKVITALEAYLLGTIRALSGKKKLDFCCTAGNDHLASAIGVTNSGSVTNMIVRLKKLGLLEQVSFNGRIRKIRVLPPSSDGTYHLKGSSRLNPAINSTIIAGLTNSKRDRSSRVHRTMESPSIVRCTNSRRDTSKVPSKEGTAGAKNAPASPLVKKPLVQVVKHHSTPEFDRQCVAIIERIEKKFAEYPKKSTPQKKDAWAKDFYKHRKASGIPEERIMATLLWWQKHFKQKYVPQVYSPNGFWSAYDKIVRQIDIAKEQEEQEPIDLSETAWAIVDEVTHGWFVKNRFCLAQAVQKSIFVLEDFRFQVSMSIKDWEHHLPGKDPYATRKGKNRYPEYFILSVMLKNPILADIHGTLVKYFRAVVENVRYIKRNSLDWVLNPWGPWWKNTTADVAASEGGDMMDLWKNKLVEWKESAK